MKIHNLFINSATGRRWGAFQFGAIANSAALNIFVHVLGGPVF